MVCTKRVAYLMSKQSSHVQVQLLVVKAHLKGYGRIPAQSLLCQPDLYFTIYSLLTDSSNVGVAIAVHEVHLAGEENRQVVAQFVPVPGVVDNLMEY